MGNSILALEIPLPPTDWGHKLRAALEAGSFNDGVSGRLAGKFLPVLAMAILAMAIAIVFFSLLLPCLRCSNKFFQIFLKLLPVA